jgi:hypothetical protein
MRYLCLIYDDETRSMSPSRRRSVRAVTTWAARPSNPFRPPRRCGSAAARSRHRRAFAETKEQLGGFYLIEARDLNEAIQPAARIPSARQGSVEVRPVREFAPP